MSDMTSMTVCEQAALIRDRRVSAVEAVEAALARIAARNPIVNAVVTVDADAALDAARRADAALARGAGVGPLHGVPVTVKDAFNTAGMRTACGYPPLAGNVPAEDATVVARLRAAGAIVLGKTNVPMLLDDIQTDNPLFGRTNNPWDPARTPGGSSGGSAAAVAAGIVPADIGSDYGGSIRIPAHFCGVYGLRPTEHRVSMVGHIPPLDGQPRAIRHITSAGPLARSVADLELLLRVIAGPDGRAWEVAPVSVDPLPALDPRSLRVAWSAGFGGLPVSADTRAALERFAAGLAMAGVRVEERDPGQFGFDVDAARETLAVISRAEWDVGGWRELDPAPGAEPAPTLHAYILALTRRDALIGAFQRLLDVFDAFICPVAPGPAFEHCPKGSAIALDGASIPYRAVASFAYPLSLLGCPVVAVPIGHSHAGLPIGAQVVGPRWGEARLLAVVDAMVAAGVAPRQSPIAW